jgi:hypothetical protein
MKRAFSSGVFVPAVTFASTWAATLAAVALIVHPVIAACSADSDVRYWPKAVTRWCTDMSAFEGKADMTFCDANVCF